MGTLIGHVAHGLGFILIGLWHLFNHTKLHAQNPNSYLDPVWFPATFPRYLELYLIMFVATTSIATELFVRRGALAPLDPDGTIPAYHLHNFEHISISMMFFIFAAFNCVFDSMISKSGRSSRPSRRELSTMARLLAVACFTQQLLMLHFHSIDHVGVEGQFHWLQQLPVGLAWAAMVAGVGWPESFTVSFVRSAAVAFLGVWLVVMGYAIWTPRFVAKGCFLKREMGNYVVQCGSEEAVERAKGLVNLLFSACLTAMAVFCVVFYVVVVRAYGCGGEGDEYLPVVKESDEHEEKMELVTSAC